MLITQHDLPDEYTLPIGKAVVKWAYLEGYLQNCIYLMVGIDDVGGRLAVREPRVPERIQLIEEIAFLRGFPINEKTMKATTKGIKEANRWRDLFAHSTWVNIPDKGWHIRDTRGKLPQEFGHKGHASKRIITPEAKLITPQFLESLCDGIDVLINNARQMQDALKEMLREQHEQFLQQIQEGKD